MSGYDEVIRRTWEEDRLFTVLVELTYRCNLDCFFCYNDRTLAGRPLTRSQYINLFEDLRDLQVLHLSFSGGEPMVHPDFFELGAKARELGFVIRVKTNGHTLAGTTVRRLLAEVDPFLIEVSLHGATAATHDRQTRVPGSFERLLSNLHGLLELGARLKINSTLTLWNEHEVSEIFAIADSLGVLIQFDPDVTPRDDGNTEPLSVAPTRAGLRRLLRIERERGLRAGSTPDRPLVVREGDQGLPTPDALRHCGAGVSSLVVDPHGSVLPCVQWRHPVGNLHTESVREIWQRSQALLEVRRANESAKSMVDGIEGGRAMAFCPGLAVMRAGRPNAIYDQAVTRREVVEELDREGDVTS